MRISLKLSPHLRRDAILATTIWTAVIVLGACWHLWEVYENTLESARIQASYSFEKDVVYRHWAAGHGGVYAPVTEKTRPNPYLSHLPNRDVTTTSGLELTLINPAYMTRQVHEIGRKKLGHQSHITSLDPIRPQNAPDAWEASALRALEQGQAVVSSIETLHGQKHMRLMRPLITEKGCLKCHAVQGYKEGDLRGGISVSVPMAPLWANMLGHMVSVTINYVLIWLLGLGGIGIGALCLERRVRDRDRAREKLAQSELYYRSLIKNMHEDILVIDSDYRITDMNNSALRTLGAKREDIIGRHCYEVSHGLDSPCHQHGERCGLRTVFDTGKHCNIQHKHLAADGTPVPVDLLMSPLKDADGTVTHVVEAARDLTDLVRTHRAMQKSEERFRGIFDNMTSGVAIYEAVDDGKDFLFVDFNPAEEWSEKISRGELVGKRLTEIFPNLAKSGFLDALQRVWRTGEPEYCPVSHLKDAQARGQQAQGQRECYIYRLASGEIIAVYSDATKHKDA